jgi:serine/threonine protein kinase
MNAESKKTFGTPFAVAHNVKVTKNAEGGYDGLPKEWQVMLEQSGIDKKDVIENPHAVLHIMEYHIQQQNKKTDKILPTPVPVARIPRGTLLSPLPPLPMPPSTPRGGSSTTEDLSDSANLPVADELDEDVEASVYTIDDIITRGNPTTLYRDITQIGQGANAEVFSGFSIKTGAKVAIKKLRWDPSKSQSLINEIQIMKSSVHTNVIKCTDCFLCEGELWVIMEYIDFGCLTDVLDQYPKGLQLTEAQIAFLCSHTLRALEYIHNQGIIHRDVKTDNILLGMDGRVKLADFGSAARLTPTRPSRKTVIGSPYWMAPELIRGEEYSQKVDIFSLGCTIQELAVGEPPFSEYPPLKTLFLLATSDVPPLKNEDQKWTPIFMDFANKCVKKDPANRPSASDLLAHPFLGLACTQEEFTEVIKKAISLRDQILSVFGM